MAVDADDDDDNGDDADADVTKQKQQKKNGGHRDPDKLAWVFDFSSIRQLIRRQLTYLTNLIMNGNHT